MKKFLPLIMNAIKAILILGLCMFYLIIQVDQPGTTRLLKIKVESGKNLAKKDIFGARYVLLLFCPFSFTHSHFLTPAERMFLGVYWNQPVCLSVCLPVRLSVYKTLLVVYKGGDWLIPLKTKAHTSLTHSHA